MTLDDPVIFDGRRVYIGDKIVEIVRVPGRPKDVSVNVFQQSSGEVKKLPVIWVR